MNSIILGAGVAVMMSISDAICLQYESKGRSLTSSPKGFSSSRPMVTKLRIIYAATDDYNESVDIHFFFFFFLFFLFDS